MASSRFSSKRPRVLGLVIINPATVSSHSFRRASRSMFPRRSEGMLTTRRPAIAEEAGFVPWAESGISILIRFFPSPRSRW